MRPGGARQRRRLRAASTSTFPTAASAPPSDGACELFTGLGFQFWLPADSGAARPGRCRTALRRARACSRATGSCRSTGRPVKDSTTSSRRSTPHPGETHQRSRIERGGVRAHRAGARSRARRSAASASAASRSAQPTDITYPPSMCCHHRLSPVAARWAGPREEAWNMTALQGRLFWRMVLGQVSLKNLSGPLSIAEYAGESAEAGVASFLSFLVLISLSLGFLNLLPIPDPRRRADRLSAGRVAEGQPAVGAGAGIRPAGGHCIAHPPDGCGALQRYRAPVQLIESARGPQRSATLLPRRRACERGRNT